MCPFFITKQGKSIFISLTKVKTDPLSILPLFPLKTTINPRQSDVICTPIINSRISIYAIWKPIFGNIKF